MLLTTPTEIKTEICKYVSRRDLASLLRTCSSLYAVAGRVLYAHVKLNSVDRVEAFFFSPPILRQGAVTVAQHHALKRSQWKGIKTLDIEVDIKTYLPLSALPPSLIGDGTNPLRVERARLTYTGGAILVSRYLTRILRAFSPAKVGIHSPRGGDLGIEDLTATTGWKDVTNLTFNARRVVPSSFSGPRTIHPPFAQVKTVRLILSWSARRWPIYPDDIGFLLRLCPALEAIKIVVGFKGHQFDLEANLRQGLEGKPATFFSVEVAAEEADAWGDVKEDEVS